MFLCTYFTKLKTATCWHIRNPSQRFKRRRLNVTAGDDHLNLQRSVLYTILTSKQVYLYKTLQWTGDVPSSVCSQCSQERRLVLFIWSESASWSNSISILTNPTQEHPVEFLLVFLLLAFSGNQGMMCNLNLLQQNLPPFFLSSKHMGLLHKVPQCSGTFGTGIFHDVQWRPRFTL